MSPDGVQDGAALARFQEALVERDRTRYDLMLFVNGASALSARAVADVRALGDAYLHGRYRLQVVDLRRNPGLVASRGVLASPTLIKDQPLPKRVLVGDLSDTGRLLRALDIEPLAHSAPGSA